MIEIAFFVGVTIGLVLGLTGAGGSVFAVPLLVGLLDLNMTQAVGLSLGAVAASTSLGVALQWRSGQVAWLPALVFAALGSLTAPLGNWANQFIPELWLFLGFSLLVFILSIRMWFLAGRDPSYASTTRASIQGDQTQSRDPICRLNEGKRFQFGLRCLSGIAVGALITGFLSGLLGVGGGFLIVPLLIALTDISIRQAVASSLVVIAFISTSGFVSYLNIGHSVSIPLMLAIAGGGFVGMILGILLSKRIAGPGLQKLFAVAMVLLLVVTSVTRFIM